MNPETNSEVEPQSKGSGTDDEQSTSSLISKMPEWEYAGQEEEAEKFAQELLSSKWRMSTG